MCRGGFRFRDLSVGEGEAEGEAEEGLGILDAEEGFDMERLKVKLPFAFL